jgi:hypothetical protein
VKRSVGTYSSANLQMYSLLFIFTIQLSSDIFNFFLGSKWSVIVMALHITLTLDFRVAMFQISDESFAAMRKPLVFIKFL